MLTNSATDQNETSTALYRSLSFFLKLTKRGLNCYCAKNSERCDNHRHKPKIAQDKRGVANATCDLKIFEKWVIAKRCRNYPIRRYTPQVYYIVADVIPVATILRGRRRERQRWCTTLGTGQRQVVIFYEHVLERKLI